MKSPAVAQVLLLDGFKATFKWLHSNLSFNSSEDTVLSASPNLERFMTRDDAAQPTVYIYEQAKGLDAQFNIDTQYYIQIKTNNQSLPGCWTWQFLHATLQFQSQNRDTLVSMISVMQVLVQGYKPQSTTDAI
jgi:hypothetical protein